MLCSAMRDALEGLEGVGLISGKEALVRLASPDAARLHLTGRQRARVGAVAQSLKRV